MISKYTSIKEFIKEKREIMGLTQEELGKKVGLSAPTISLYESGDRKPELDILERLANILGSTFAEMLNIEVPEKNLNIALRSEKLNQEDVKKVKQYIQWLKYERKSKETK